MRKIEKIIAYTFLVFMALAMVTVTIALIHHMIIWEIRPMYWKDYFMGWLVFASLFLVLLVGALAVIIAIKWSFGKLGIDQGEKKDEKQD